ncbi:MAG: hypothetical protein ACR2M3_00820 [Thermomicrobiales bacterium]
MWIEWRIRWRGDDAIVRWENSVLISDNAVTAAFGRFAISNAPATDRPPEERLANPVLTKEMMAEFADAIIETETDSPV